MPRQQAGIVRPLQIVHHHDQRRGRAQLVHQRQQPLDAGRHRIAPAQHAGHRLHLQEIGEISRSRVARTPAQALHDGPQREPLAQLVADRPRRSAAELGHVRKPRSQQPRLADPGLALHPDGATTSAGDPSHQASQQVELGVAPDKRPGQRCRPHTAQEWADRTPVSWTHSRHLVDVHRRRTGQHWYSQAMTVPR
jgi:hypothetical protein